MKNVSVKRPRNSKKTGARSPRLVGGRHDVVWGQALAPLQIMSFFAVWGGKHLFVAIRVLINGAERMPKMSISFWITPLQSANFLFAPRPKKTEKRGGVRMVEVIFLAHLTSFRLTRKDSLDVTFWLDYARAFLTFGCSASAKEDGEVGRTVQSA